MVTLENGCVCRSLHGHLRREHQRNYNYMYYGDFGMMETGRFTDQPLVNLYKESDKYCTGTWERFDPKPRIAAEGAATTTGHLGSDYYSTHFFMFSIVDEPYYF